jgi:chromosome segregation ATPase
MNILVLPRLRPIGISTQSITTWTQVLAISADNTRNMAQLQQSMAQLQQTVAAPSASVTKLTTYIRTHQHDEELDDHDGRVERLERDPGDHADRMAKLDETLAEVKDVQKDIRAIWQMMTQRFAGESWKERSFPKQRTAILLRNISIQNFKSFG